MALAFPPRSDKPRSRGLTSVIDYGPDELGWTGVEGVRDLVTCVGAYIDYAKIYAMNALLLPAEPLKAVIRLYRDAEVAPYAGGILFEYAWRNNATDELVDHLRGLNLRALEISENYITLGRDERSQVIDRMAACGFQVIYEYGRKNPEGPLDPGMLEFVVCQVREAGAKHVIVEQSELDALRLTAPETISCLAAADWFDAVWIEADPYAFPAQHVGLLQTFGPEVNLANIPAGQALRLEGLRRGIGRAVDYWLLSEKASP